MSESNRVGLEGLSGLLVHSNCDSTDFGELLDTVLQLQKHLGDLLYDIQWVNLGGGYIFDSFTDLQPFHKAIDILHSQYDIQIFILSRIRSTLTLSHVPKSRSTLPRLS